MDQTFFISQHEVLHALGTANAPFLIDVCVAEDVAADPYRVPGSHRRDHRDACNLAQQTPEDRTVVVVCQKGRKLSQGVAAYLRAGGCDARVLRGGVLQWGADGLPRIPEAVRAHTYVLSPPCTADTYLAAWLIRRWIAPDARILWVPQDAAHDVADRFDARHLAQEQAVAALLRACALTWTPLVAFLNANHGWKDLLRAPEQMHGTPDAAVNAALPVIDAAWVALRKSAS